MESRDEKLKESPGQELSFSFSPPTTLSLLQTLCWKSEPLLQSIRLSGSEVAGGGRRLLVISPLLSEANARALSSESIASQTRLRCKDMSAAGALEGPVMVKTKSKPTNN